MSAANINHLGRRLAHCVDIAREVEEARETDPADFGSLVLAAAILDKILDKDVSHNLPGYAADLMLAAKLVCNCQEAIYSSRSMERLSDCISRFEEAMPLNPDGEILTTGKRAVWINEDGVLVEPPPIVFEDEEN
ncbi:MAG: hypothetical protein LBO79_02775 [Zoogloeaceae bacterium]|jgi:hypothetical protein|nr:hypothetical protein [Zoogloeaceae bacterium]